MNAQKPITAACPLGSKAGVATPPRSASATQLVAGPGCSPVPGSAASPIGATGSCQHNGPTGEAGAPNLSTFSLTSLLGNARKLEKATSDESEIAYMLNIAEELRKALPGGPYVSDHLDDFIAALKEAEDDEASERAGSIAAAYGDYRSDCRRNDSE